MNTIIKFGEDVEGYTIPVQMNVKYEHRRDYYFYLCSCL